MLLVADVKQDKRRAHDVPTKQALFGIDKLNVARSEIPAVTHVDYSARIQTVHARHQPAVSRACSARFKALTGCPVLVNTSFNVRGEPIVCTPEDAFRCFMGNELDLLVVGNCVLQKAAQDPALKINYSFVARCRLTSATGFAASVRRRRSHRGGPLQKHHHQAEAEIEQRQDEEGVAISHHHRLAVNDLG